MTRLLFTLVALAASGCAGPGLRGPVEDAPTEASPRRATGPTALQRRYDDDGRPLEEPPAPRLPEGLVRLAPTSTSPSDPATIPPARRGKRDVRLRDARLDDALRMLAEAANLGLVLPEPLTQPIRLELRAVDPVDVIEMLAASHGLEVRWQGRVLVVRPHGDPG